MNVKRDKQLKYTVPVSVEEHKTCENYVCDTGLNSSQAFRDAMSVMTTLHDKGMLSLVDDLSGSLHSDRKIVIANIIASYFAHLAARKEVYGDNLGLVPEFIPTFEGMMTGSNLFDHLYEVFLEKEVNYRILFLLSEEEKWGPDFMSQEEVNFLIKHKVGDAWEESEEGKKEMAKLQKHSLEARAKGLVPPDCPIDDQHLGLLYCQLKAKEIPREIFEKKLSEIRPTRPLSKEKLVL